jgi:hypothetical protein
MRGTEPAARPDRPTRVRSRFNWRVRFTAAGAAAGSILGLLILMSWTRPVIASCALPPGEVGPRWSDADIVILGTVRAVADQDRIATVVVEEIWRGPDLPPEVTVRGGFGTGATFTSGDRTFETDVRYLFDLRESEGSLQDNACSLTAPWSADLAALRPADARLVGTRPSSDANAIDLAGPLGILVIVGAVALTLLGLALGIRRLDV